MATTQNRVYALDQAINRTEREFDYPVDQNGVRARVCDYFGENLYDFSQAQGIPETVKEQILESSQTGKRLDKEHAEIVAKAVLEWSLQKGVTHFCHWFQPLTGATAEKHDSFLSFEDGRPIESLSATQLMQGEPDASSFPNGGARSTFEARGYTSWDLTSPLFIIEGINGKTLCIPTAFISYHGEALDIKTPLLRSVSTLDKAATKFLQLTGSEDVTSVMTTCGCEQEYFLIDKALAYARPDLVMTGRTMFGSLTARNQQLDDHYFGPISERVLSFMEELDYELYRLGIPAKTRHNEVAPGQFEIAPIYSDANISADNNQVLMAIIKTVANRHNFMALLHEKPFANINGSGKHVNWAMEDSNGKNLLEPGKEPHSNLRFLSVVAIIVEAVNRRAKLLRTAISSAGNDHRLGANEAPPSIISVFLGDTLGSIFENIHKDNEIGAQRKDQFLETGANQLASLAKDNTDRNRTSPFAFTGNKFEFRAVGSQAAVGLPVSILNAAVAEVLEETNAILEKDLATGISIDEALYKVSKKWIDSSFKVIFNGDGYSDEWVKEAESRGLPNLKTTADCLDVLKDEKETAYLVKSNIFNRDELNTRFNVLVERYNTLREIEFDTLLELVHQNVIPAALAYKKEVGQVIKTQKEIGLESTVEIEIYKRINFTLESLFAKSSNLTNSLKTLPEDDLLKSKKIASELLPLSEAVAQFCDELEEMLPNELWSLPKYYDLLFIR